VEQTESDLSDKGRRFCQMKILTAARKVANET